MKVEVGKNSQEETIEGSREGPAAISSRQGNDGEHPDGLANRLDAHSSLTAQDNQCERACASMSCVIRQNAL